MARAAACAAAVAMLLGQEAVRAVAGTPRTPWAFVASTVTPRFAPPARSTRSQAPFSSRGGLRLRMAEGAAASDSRSDEGFQAYIQAAPQRLMSHLRNWSSHDEDGRVKTKKFVIELEQLQVAARESMCVYVDWSCSLPARSRPAPLPQNFPYDVDFFNWAVNGSWDLQYSSSRLGVPDPNLRLRNIQAGEPACMRACKRASLR